MGNCPSHAPRENSNVYQVRQFCKTDPTPISSCYRKHGCMSIRDKEFHVLSETLLVAPLTSSIDSEPPIPLPYAGVVW